MISFFEHRCSSFYLLFSDLLLIGSIFRGVGNKQTLFQLFGAVRFFFIKQLIVILVC